ncbi:MAG: hypothetical protein WCA44_05900 [Acidobacteriaceae bacterium]
MSAIELYEKDGRATGVFFCSSCRVVHATQDAADWCHGERLCACGTKIPTHQHGRTCNECQSKEWRERDAKKEAERFEAAAKITEADYHGEHVYLGDEYYDSVEDAIDEYLEGQEPEYVWACREHGLPKVDIEDVTSNLLDNMWDDADTSDLSGIEELEAALVAFNKANEHVQLWEPDYTTAILLQP